MTIEELLLDKTKKAKEKVLIISRWLAEGSLSTDELIDATSKAKDPEKGNCIEALEFATRENPAIATENVFDFAVAMLKEKAPRIKWESAKVIGNSISNHTGKIGQAAPALLENASHPGTVVRWSTAYAFSEIVKTGRAEKALVEKIKSVAEGEEKASIQNIYRKALPK